MKKLLPLLSKIIISRFPDGGERVYRYVYGMDGMKLWDYKVVHFSRLVRKLKPRTVLELGSGASTILLTELLERNKRKYGIDYKLYSVEQSEKYYDYFKKNFPTNENVSMSLEKVLHIEDFNGRKVIKYENYPITDPDLLYIDGPYDENPYINGDLLYLKPKYAVNDGRKFNIPYFEEKTDFKMKRSELFNCTIITPR